MKARGVIIRLTIFHEESSGERAGEDRNIRKKRKIERESVNGIMICSREI